MSQKIVLLQQFDTCFDRNGWFVSVRNSIDGVTAEEAAWRPEGTDNTIWESLAHLTYYNHAYLQRFKGIEFEYDTADNDTTFAQGDAVTDEAWSAEIERFDRVMKEFRDLLNAADGSKLSEPVPTNTSRNWWEVIAEPGTPKKVFRDHSRVLSG